MDEHKLLIYHYSDRNQKWYDATSFISYIKKERGTWVVRFQEDGDFYHISFSKMVVFDKPVKIDFFNLYLDDDPVFGAKELLLFNKRVFKIFYSNGYTKVAKFDRIHTTKNVLEQHPQAKGVLSYYQEVVKETAENEEDRFLIQEFEKLKIDGVNSDSVLAYYLRRRLGKSTAKITTPLIAPFGTNKSQHEAITTTLRNRVSIIEGPPGTGKTQTILNFIANAITNGLTVAVASNNNSATNNVFQKLEKNNYSFFAAPLGNADNVDAFFENYHSKIPELQQKGLSQKELIDLGSLLPAYYEIENDLKRRKETLASIRLEHRHFLADNPGIQPVTIVDKRLSSSRLLESLAKIKEKRRIGLFARFSLRRKLKDFHLPWRGALDDYVPQLMEAFYQLREREEKEAMVRLHERMGNETVSGKTVRYKSLSKIAFENYLSSYFEKRPERDYQKDDYRWKFTDFVKDYPVVLSSTYSLARCSKRRFLFDYLIIDESSQVNMASAMLAMALAKNLVVVGDLAQLPQIDDDSFKERDASLRKQFEVSPEYAYYGNSIMSSLLALYGKSIAKVTLCEHYRCDPDIIGFCNEEFYNRQLVIYTARKEHEKTMRIIHTAPGNFARKNPEGTGLYNQREIDEIQRLLKENNFDDVGVIAPYRCQAEEITKQLSDLGIEASTIHKFQGREKKTIIFSSVVNDVNDFVDNDNLINVAVSRAIDRFILVTSDKVAKSNQGTLSDLVHYIAYHQGFGSEEQGKIHSIYDLLYADYQAELDRFNKRHPSSEFASENLTRVLLNKIILEERFANVRYRMHVSLKDFMHFSPGDLTSEEQKFFFNPNSHADFVLFNRMSRRPLLVIEVDGVSFHEQRKAQKTRDAKKNAILEKAQIPLLRLKTNESNEEARIAEALAKILK